MFSLFKQNFLYKLLTFGLFIAFSVTSVDASEIIENGFLVYKINTMYDGSHSATVKGFGNEKYTTNLIIPPYVEYNGENCKVIEIDDKAFYYDVFETVELGENLQIIGTDAFYSAFVENLTIPASVTSIYSRGIPACYNLTIESNGQDNESPLQFREPQIWGGSDDYHLGGVRKLYLDRNIYGAKFRSVSDITFGPNVTNLCDELFYECSEITNLVLPNNLEKIGCMTFYGTSITSLEIPPSVISIGELAFANTEIEFLKVNGIEGNPGLYINNAFNDFKIKNIIFNRNVGYKGDIFHSVQHIEIGGYATSLPNFSECQELIDVTIKSAVTELGGTCFSNCNSLKKVVLPEALETIGVQCFYGCSSLEDITIPNNVKNIYDKAFYNCTSLRNATIGENVRILSPYAFYNCCQLESVKFQPGIEKIEENAFSYCSSIKQIILPEGLTRIGSEAFSNCQSMTEVNFPSSFDTFYGSGQFYGCDNLSTIICNGEIPAELSYGSINMPFDSQTYQKAVLIVPETAIQSYKASNPWKNFLNVSKTDAIMVESNLIRIYNGKPVSNNNENFQITIITCDGRLVYSGLIFESPTLTQGIYMIAIDKSSFAKYAVNY